MLKIILIIIIFISFISCNNSEIETQKPKKFIMVYIKDINKLERWELEDYNKRLTKGNFTVLNNSLSDIYDKLNDKQREEYLLHIATELTKSMKYKN